jgi:DNA-binding NarL/FixJ family response regulator
MRRTNARGDSDALLPPPPDSQGPYRVLIVDDHAVVRVGLRAILETRSGLEIVSEADTAAGALEDVKRLKPDLAIVDLTLPDANGLELISAIRQESPDTAVMVLTMHFSDEVAREVLKAGALGYVLNSDAYADLLVAVDQVRHKQPFFTSSLALTMAQKFVEGPGEATEVSQLTERELEVVTLLAEGKSNKEVAAKLDISTRTIESHRNHIMRKMGFHTYSELVRFAVRNNLVGL